VVNALNQVVREITREVQDGTGIRYRRDTSYDANDNVVRVDVENRNDLGGLDANAELTTTFDYEVLNNLVRKTEEVDEGHSIVTEYGYDANRNRTLVRFGQATNGQQPENTVTYEYDERDLLFREIRAAGHAHESVTRYDYDGRGNQAAVRHGINAPDGGHVTRQFYDAYNRRVATLDPMGNVTRFSYDANGNLVREIHRGELDDQPGGLNPEDYCELLFPGLPELCDPPTGNSVVLRDVAYTYDDMDRVAQTDEAFFDTATGAPIGDGLATTQTVYSDDSQVIQTIDDRGNATLTAYDTASRRHVVTDAKSNTVTYEYDGNSNVVRIDEVDKSDLGSPDQHFATVFAYDNLDRLIRTTDNVGSVNRSFYDSRNNRVRTVDALDHEIRYVYDGLDRLLRTIRDMNGDGADPNAQPNDAGPDIVTAQTWDDSSRLTSQTDDNGNPTTYVYDGLNRKVAEVYADFTEKHWQYDAHDNNAAWDDANQNQVTQHFDDNDRMIRRDVIPGPGVSDDTTFEVYKYDGRSRLTWAEDDDTLVTRQYDSLGRVTRETQDLYDDPEVVWPTAVVGTVYDAVGNQTELHYPSGRLVVTTYDELNRKKVIADGTEDPDGPELIAEYWYVGPDRVEQRDYGNGTRTDYTYDGITGVPNPPGDYGVKHIIRTNAYRVADGVTIDDRTYAWDRMGNKTQRKDIRADGPQLTHAYTYDAVYRLIQSVKSGPDLDPETIQYVLDGVGNRTEVLGGSDAGLYTMDDMLQEPADRQMNQYTTTPFDSRTHDPNGSLSEVSAPPQYTSHTYNYANAPVSLSAAHTSRYSYDALRRRVSIAHPPDDSRPLQRGMYSGWKLCEWDVANSGVSLNLVHGRFIDEVLEIVGPEVAFVYSDDLHSSVALTVPSIRQLHRIEYEDFGTPTFEEPPGCGLVGSISAFTALLTGREYDCWSLHYYYRTRFLEPRTGRFSSRDVGGAWQDQRSLGNPLVYVGNNPMTLLDPFGLQSAGSSYPSCFVICSIGWFPRLPWKLLDRCAKPIPYTPQYWDLCMRTCMDPRTGGDLYFDQFGGCLPGDPRCSFGGQRGPCVGVGNEGYTSCSSPGARPIPDSGDLGDAQDGDGLTGVGGVSGQPLFPGR